MRNFFLFIVFLFFMSCSIHKTQKLPTKFYYRYTVNSGHVVYVYNGLKEGRDELFFDNFGHRQVKYTNLIFKMGTKEKNIHTSSLYKNDSVYFFNYGSQKLDKYTEDYLFDEAQKLKTLDLGMAQIKLLEEQGYLYRGDKEYLHKKCKVYTTPDSSRIIYFWKHIPLYSESKVLNIKNIQKAIRIQTELDIPEEKFHPQL